MGERITPMMLHEIVDKINGCLVPEQYLHVDGTRDADGIALWRLGPVGQPYHELPGDAVQTSQMYQRLHGFLACIEAGYAGPRGVSVPESGNLTHGIEYMRGYVVDEQQVVLFNSLEQQLSIPNTGLIPGGHYVFEVRTGVDGEQRSITNYRQAAPIEIEALDPQEADLVIPIFTGGGSGIFYPQPDPTFMMTHDQEAFFELLFTLAQTRPQKGLISGPPGTGKTEGAREYAARMGYGVIQMSCGMMESASEWFGSRRVDIDPETGSAITTFDESAFIRALETPNTLIILDEYNRLHSTLQNSLYNLFDDIGMAWVDHELKRYVRVAAGVVIIATANIGARHTGTFVIDEAMADRFTYHLKLDYLVPDKEKFVLQQRTGVDEDVAERLVAVANKIREIASDPESDSPIMEGISFRQLLKASEAMACGMSPVQAASITIFSKFSPEGGEASAQAKVREIFQGKFG